MRILRDIIGDFEARRISEAEAREELRAIGATDAEADEFLGMAGGGDDVIEVSAVQADALEAEPEPDEDE